MSAAFQCMNAPMQGLQLIEASAGTGKTYTICLLYLRLLLERGLTVERLLVVTFTNAAAAELRERIRSRLVEVQALLAAAAVGDRAVEWPAHTPVELRDLLSAVVADEPQAARTALQQVRLALQCFDQAAIFTIHGFCQRAMGDAPFVAGAPLSTELLTSDEDLRLEVVQDFWRREVAGQNLPDALVQALCGAGDSPARFAEWLRRAQSRPLARAEWGDLQGGQDSSALQVQLTEQWNHLQQLWPEARQVVPEMVAQAREGLSKNVFSESAVARAAQDWAALIASGDPWSVADEDSKLHLYRRDKLVFTAAGRKLGLVQPDHAFLDAAQGFLLARQSLLQAGAALRKQLLHRMLAQCGPALRQRKRALRVQAFDDMLYNLHAALQSAQGDALATSLRARYPAALVDEFQDTDPLQWQILQAIYDGGDLPRFLVGDPKQAIYRFRNADLPTYLAARQCVPPGLRHSLTHNQRSSAALIAACNALFSVHPAAFIEAGLDYPAVAAGTRRKAELHDARPLARSALQVWLLPRGTDDQLPGLDAARALAADGCASEIVQLLQGAADGLVRLDAAPLQAGHIAVLVQSHAQGRLMRAALEQRGVQCVELSQASVFASPDAADFLCILQAVLQPAQEALVRDALATGWLGGTALQIDNLAASQQGLAPVMERFADALRRWRAGRFAAMIRRLLEQHGVHARLLQQPDGPRRLTNLRQLLELAQGAQRTHPAPEALVSWLRQQIEQPGARDDAAQLRLESDAQLVRIVTVHAAKGLEYPVVFCPFLWVNSPLRSPSDGAIDYPSREDGAALVMDYRSELERTADADWIRTARQQATDAERLRLIYVALTRAAQRCYLVAGTYASGKVQRDGQPNTTQAACSPLSWLVLGGGQAWPEWRSRKRVGWHDIDQGWHALAQAVDDATVLSVQHLPPATRQRLVPPAFGAGSLQAAVPPGMIPPRRRLGSYSALVSAGSQTHSGDAAVQPEGGTPSAGGSGGSSIESLLLQDIEQRDHDAAADVLPLLPNISGVPPTDSAVAATDGTVAIVPAPPAAAVHDILQFPRGAEAGTCIHGVFERIDFRQPAQWAEVSRHVLATQGLPLTLQPMVLNMLHDVLHTPLPPGFHLAELARERCQAELEFHLPAPDLDAGQLKLVLDRHHLASPSLQFPDLHGHLKGFIDLVFEHQGRWYVLDWKSNHLGDTPAHYAQPALAQAMARHDYGLQALLYLLALDRFLACRLRGYQRSQHLGGALYLFVRGVRPDWRDTDGQATGIWYLPASPAALDDLAQALAGEDLSAQSCAKELT